jgi:alcohol dehydrogenase class IV
MTEADISPDYCCESS